MEFFFSILIQSLYYGNWYRIEQAASIYGVNMVLHFSFHFIPTSMDSFQCVSFLKLHLFFFDHIRSLDSSS